MLQILPFPPPTAAYARQGTGFQLPVRLRRFAEQNVPPLWSRSIDDAGISECLCILLQFWSITVLSVIVAFKLNSRLCHVQTRALAEWTDNRPSTPFPFLFTMDSSSSQDTGLAAFGVEQEENLCTCLQQEGDAYQTSA
jgi:hypothetical protein